MKRIHVIVKSDSDGSGFSFPVSRFCVISDKMITIDLENNVGNNKLSDEVLRSLVTRNVTCEHLAELARPFGYTDGPALGVTVGVVPETGEVKGGIMTVFGTGNPVVYISKPEGIPIRKLWPKAGKDLNLLVEIRVS